MTKALFVGAPVDAPADGLDANDQFEKTGRNTGNLLIGTALRRQLVIESYATGTHFDPAHVNDAFDLIVIPAANFIYERFDFGYLADFIGRTRLPCLMVGIGAQSHNMSTFEINIPEGTKRFLKIVSERCKSIGVRGEYTAGVLERLGVNNVTVTGCPSLYWNMRPNVEMRRKSEALQKVVVNGSANVIQHSIDPIAAANVERQLLETAVGSDYDYVLQNEFPEIDIAVGGKTIGPEEMQGLAATLRRIETSIQPDAYRDFLTKHGKVFFNLDRWSEFISNFELSIGTRFHGNVIAMISGVPAIILPHDTRTLEMCQLSKIPHVSIAEISTLDVQKIYSEADFEGFTSNFPALYKRYVEFFETNGVAHHLNDWRQDKEQATPLWYRPDRTRVAALG